jgi:hypothetical protein
MKDKGATRQNQSPLEEGNKPFLDGMEASFATSV